MCESAGVCKACKDKYGKKGTDCAKCSERGCIFCPIDNTKCCRCAMLYDLVNSECKPHCS